MSRLSLRARVVAGAVAAIVLVVGALGITVAVLVGNELRGSLDQTLRDRAIGVVRLGASTPGLLTAPGALASPTGGTEAEVEVVSRTGAVIAASPALGGRRLPGEALVRHAISAGGDGYATANFGGNAMRLYAAPMPETGGAAAGGAVLVGSSLSSVQETLGHVRAAIALSAVAAALLGGLLVALVAGRGLRPLRRLTAAAGAIGTGADPAARLPEDDAPREVAELTATLNGMLAALERSRATERRFLADASHQLRTPLTALRGNAAYLARHGTDAEVLAEIDDDAKRVGRLIDDLLALERAESNDLPYARVDLAALATDEARRAGAELGELDAAVVWGDGTALAGALANLLDNARLHGPVGGPVTVSLTADGREARLSVADAGPGIPPDRVEEAFGRFWRGPDAAVRPGSGLGLAIVRATATAHRGEVAVDGSRMTLVLPLAGTDADAPPGPA
jgi:two-component system OmpR family sensor kinase